MLPRYIVSNSIINDDQLLATYAILMNNSIDKILSETLGSSDSSACTILSAAYEYNGQLCI